MTKNKALKDTKWKKEGMERKLFIETTELRSVEKEEIHLGQKPEIPKKVSSFLIGRVVNRVKSRKEIQKMGGRLQ